MTAGGYPIVINNLFIREHNCDGSIMDLASGGRSWFFSGNDDMTLAAGLTFETIAAIASQCFNRAERNRVSGADAILNRGCGFNAPEFDAAFLTGMHVSTGAGGETQVSFDKPGTNDCRDCAKTTSTDCDPTFSIIADYCEVDCNDNPIDRKFMVIRNVTQATLSNRKQIGGNDNTAFGGDITLTVNTNDNWGYGPGGLLVSDDENGNPECASVTCGIACPAVGLDFTDIDALCGCANEFAGCTIDAAVVAANPVLDFPLLTL